MTDLGLTGRAQLTRRKAAERRYRSYGIAAIALSIGFLVLMLASIAVQGIGAFTQTKLGLSIVFSEDVLDPQGTRDEKTLRSANYTKLVRDALQAQFPDVTGRRNLRELGKLASSGAGFELRQMVLDDPSLIGSTKKVWLTASDDIDMLVKGNIALSEDDIGRRVSIQQARWLDVLRENGAVKRAFNLGFFTQGDSREPELAGIVGAIAGSALSLAVCFALSFPLGTLAAIYLEEFAKKNRWSDLIEININNLAAVPSIVFGLLGLAILLNTFNLPRSTPLVGGMVLALMTLPTIIIASRASLRAVPPSIREAALAMGASRIQTTFHHVVPLAMPGMLTGAIIGMAQALGETAPLLMIGMVAFIVDVPTSILDPATALPVQIFLWADSPERAFLERTSAAILVLLTFLIIMNLVAIVMRRKLERRW